jgi:hypothetical protein
MLCKTQGHGLEMGGSRVSIYDKKAEPDQLEPTTPQTLSLQGSCVKNKTVNFMSPELYN